MNRILPYCLAIGQLMVFNHCSTLYSHYRQAPRANTAIELTRFQNRDYAVFNIDNVMLHIGVPVSGVNRLSIGPCLLPLLPWRREKPQSLTIEIQLKSNADLELSPHNWHVQFDDLWGEQKDLTPHLVEIFSDNPRNNYKASILIWDKQFNKGTKELKVPATAYVLLTFPVFDNRFKKFQLNGILSTRDQEISLPAISFERENDLVYEAWTTKWWDVLE